MSIVRFSIFAMSLFLSSACLAASAEEALRGKAVHLGYLEDVTLGARNLQMKAKLDTGADTSSVYARDIDIYKRGERDNWVRFRLIGKDGRSVRYNQNVIRFVHIKTKKGGSIRRPVIHLPLCVAGIRALAEINLANRAMFDFDLLVGREFLANRALVDSGQTYIATESCLEPEESEEGEADDGTSDGGGTTPGQSEITGKETDPGQ